MPLTKEQIASFHKEGFLIIKNFFSMEELNYFMEASRLVIRATLKKAGLDPAPYANQEFDKGILDLENISHAFIADIYDTICQLPSFLRIIAKRDTTWAINQLLSREVTDPLYAFTCRCRIDPPFDDRRTYGWHQEVFYTIPQSQFLQTWAPLIRDTTVENGTIAVCPGSHQEGIAAQTWHEAPERAKQIIVEEEVVAKYPQRDIPMRLGELLIFHSQMFHRSGKNVSNHVRYSLVGMYHNPDHPTFRPAGIKFDYKSLSPRQYFESIFGNLVLPK